MVADADVVAVVTVVADSGADADSGAVIPRKLRIVLPRLMSRWETCLGGKIVPNTVK